MTKDTKVQRELVDSKGMKRPCGFQELCFLLATVGLFSPLFIKVKLHKTLTHFPRSLTAAAGNVFQLRKTVWGGGGNPELNQALHSFKWTFPPATWGCEESK